MELKEVIHRRKKGIYAHEEENAGKWDSIEDKGIGNMKSKAFQYARIAGYIGTRFQKNHATT